MVWDGEGGPLPPLKNVSKVNKEISKLIVDSNNLNKEKVKFNIDKALSLNCDIFYKDTEDGKTEVTVLSNDGKSVTETFDNVSLEAKSAIDIVMSIRKKNKSKNEAKSKINVRFKVGDIVLLRGKIRDGSKRNIKKFEVKKVIWSVKGNPVNVLILKQIEGINNNMSLDKNDCKKYHIKYEEGLQAYSMMMNFVKLKRK